MKRKMEWPQVTIDDDDDLLWVGGERATVSKCFGWPNGNEQKSRNNCQKRGEGGGIE